MKRPPLKSSVPNGKDESRLVTTVREQWDAYQVHEKRFSKAFALALINLHKQLAKPGYGSFVAKLTKLKIPKSTAYRLMRLHGWKPEKQTGLPPKPAPDEVDRRSKVCKVFREYLGATSPEQCIRLTTELLQEIYPDRVIKVTIE